MQTVPRTQLNRVSHRAQWAQSWSHSTLSLSPLATIAQPQLLQPFFPPQLCYRTQPSRGLCLDSRSCPISRTAAHIMFSSPVPGFCSCLSSVMAPKPVCSRAARNSRLLRRPELWPYPFWPLPLSPTKSSLWYLNTCWLPLHLNFWESMIHYVAIS